MKLGQTTLYLSNEQDKGKRSYQEDFFGILSTEQNSDVFSSLTLILADGMGGLEAGDAASALAVQSFSQTFPQIKVNAPNTDIALYQAIQSTNATLFDYAKGKEVGTTFLVLHLDEGFFTWASAGDSVFFLIRDGRIRRLNHDHNLGRFLDNKLLSGAAPLPIASSKNIDRNLLTSHLGRREIPELEISKAEPWFPEDTFILCSDGLTNALSQDEIFQIVQSNPSNIASELVRVAISKNHPHQDNTTALVASFSDTKKSLSARFNPLLVLASVCSVILVIAGILGMSGFFQTSPPNPAGTQKTFAQTPRTTVNHPFPPMPPRTNVPITSPTNLSPPPPSRRSKPKRPNRITPRRICRKPTWVCYSKYLKRQKFLYKLREMLMVASKMKEKLRVCREQNCLGILTQLNQEKEKYQRLKSEILRFDSETAAFDTKKSFLSPEKTNVLQGSIAAKFNVEQLEKNLNEIEDLYKKKSRYRAAARPDRGIESPQREGTLQTQSPRTTTPTTLIRGSPPRSGGSQTPSRAPLPHQNKARKQP